MTSIRLHASDRERKGFTFERDRGLCYSAHGICWRMQAEVRHRSTLGVAIALAMLTEHFVDVQATRGTRFGSSSKQSTVSSGFFLSGLANIWRRSSPVQLGGSKCQGAVGPVGYSARAIEAVDISH